MCSELSLKTAHEHLSTEFLNVHKTNMVRKTVLGGLRTTKAENSLRFLSDLEITQLHQTRPSAAVRTWSLFRPEKVLARPLFGVRIYIFGLVIFFSFL